MTSHARSKAAHDSRTIREISANPNIHTRRIWIVSIRWVGELSAACVIRSHPHRPDHDWTIAFSDCPELRGMQRGEVGRFVNLLAARCPALPERWRIDG